MSGADNKVNKDTVVWLDKQDFAILAEAIPVDVSYSLPEYPLPNRVLFGKPDNPWFEKLVRVVFCVRKSDGQ